MQLVFHWPRSKRVILIDADLRKSRSSRKKQKQKKMVSRTGTFSGQASLEDDLCYQYQEFLHDLFRLASAEPGRASGRKNFRSLLNALRKVYDYVIVDTPPLGSVIDNAIEAEICDGFHHGDRVRCHQLSFCPGSKEPAGKEVAVRCLALSLEQGGYAETGLW